MSNYPEISLYIDGEWVKGAAPAEGLRFIAPCPTASAPCPTGGGHRAHPLPLVAL
jgi:hypothetical protein